MTINSVVDIAEVTSLGSPPGSEGFAVREGTAESEGRMHFQDHAPGENLWLLSRQWLAANEASNTWAADLASAKARRKAEVNEESHFNLANSDWFRLRAADGGTAMPGAWLTYRNDVRTAANDSWTAIDALATVDACRDHVPTWPSSP